MCVAVSHYGLICIPLVTNDVEPLFTCLFLAILSFVKCLWKSCLFKKIEFSFSLIFEKLRILETSPLLDVCN